MTRVFALPVALLAASLLLVPACGGGPATPEEVAQAMAETQCGLIGECYPETLKFYGGPSCTEEMTKVYEDSILAVVDELEADGKASFDGEVAAECLDVLENLTCVELEDVMYAGPCRDMFVGTVPVGEPCQDDWACAGDAWCDAGGTCPGTCKATVGIGEACGEAGTHQSFVSCAEGQCVEGTCQRLPVQGEACIAEDVCAWGLLCDGGICRDVSAFRTAAEGDVCEPLGTPPVLCEADLYCVAGSTGQATCEGVAASGGACAFSFPDNCPDGEYCLFDWSSGEGTCTPLGQAGDACGGYARCAPGFYCDLEAETCTSQGRIGDACAEDDHCYSDSCDGGVCAVQYSCE